VSAAANDAAQAQPTAWHPQPSDGAVELRPDEFKTLATRDS